jgi:DNA mismatch repair protein MutS
LIDLAIYLPFGTIKIQQETARVIQVLTFFKRVNNAYFATLEAELFPQFFKNAILEIQRLFSDLCVEYFSFSGIRILTITELRKVMRTMDEQVRRGQMDDFWNAFFLFEAYLSIARGIKKHGLIFPDFTGSGLKIVDFYYPSIKDAVKNSIRAESGVVLLTGPNMSGKSTLLKSLGICVYLAHLGFGVPAAKCELVYYDTISVSINLNDNIQAGYSHFMTEIQAVKDVVVEARKGKKCFAVFDELFRGTNTSDAFEISAKTILGLTQFSDSLFFISTHLQELLATIEGNGNISCHHTECMLVNEKPVFTYKLKDGWSQLKIGRILFDQQGLNDLLSLR